MSKRKFPFRSVAELDALLISFFAPLTNSDTTSLTADKKQKGEPAPPTMSGLAYHLGFDSIRDYEACETKSKYASMLRRARLRVETEYEKKLHFQSSTGAIFALKSFGWTERAGGNSDNVATDGTLKVEIINSGPQIAGEENEVIL